VIPEHQNDPRLPPYGRSIRKDAGAAGQREKGASDAAFFPETGEVCRGSLNIGRSHFEGSELSAIIEDSAQHGFFVSR